MLFTILRLGNKQNAERNEERDHHVGANERRNGEQDVGPEGETVGATESEPDRGGQDQRQQADLHPEQSPGVERSIKRGKGDRCQHNKDVAGKFLHNFSDEVQVESKENKSTEL